MHRYNNLLILDTLDWTLRKLVLYQEVWGVVRTAKGFHVLAAGRELMNECAIRLPSVYEDPIPEDAKILGYEVQLCDTSIDGSVPCDVEEL